VTGSFAFPPPLESAEWLNGGVTGGSKSASRSFFWFMQMNGFTRPSSGRRSRVGGIAFDG
jgi:hypothetical protein